MCNLSQTVAGEQKTRVALVLTSEQIPAWTRYVIETLASSPQVELLAAMTRVSAVPPNPAPRLFRWWARFDRWAYYSATDALRKSYCRDALQTNSVRVIELSDATADYDSQQVTALRDADIVIHFTRATFAKASLRTPSGRNWLVESGSTESPTTVPSLFWDMLTGRQFVEHGAQIFEHDGDAERTLFKSWGTTNQLSLALNVNDACWQLSEFIVRTLCDVPPVQALQPRVSPRRRTEAAQQSLSTWVLAGFLGAWAIASTKHRLRKFFTREQWTIALRSRRAPAGGGETVNGNDGCFAILDSPPDRFRADPFLIKQAGRTYIFFEEYPFSTQKGVISYCEIGPDGSCGKVRTAIERDYHLSYPFLFEWQGQTYLVPETRENRTIEAYRAVRFPDEWTPAGVLMSNVSAVDTTLFSHKGKWWLFTSGFPLHSSPNDSLYLFFADSPFGPWFPHPENPIVSDSRCARPAGSLYFDGDTLIRPAQDCSIKYGAAIRLQRIDVLSETEYRESAYRSITPEILPGSSGTHTFNQNEDYEVIDSRRVIPRVDPRLVINRIRSLL